MVKFRVYDEIVDFIASGSSPEAVIAFKPSSTTSKRVEELVNKEKIGKLTDDEKSELEHFLLIEHLMRLAKAKAFQLLNS